MDDDTDLFIYGMFLVAVIAGVVSGMAANSVTSEHYRTEAIKRGYAEHDAKTGEWRWVEPKGIAE